MSRTSTGKPEFRLRFDYPHLEFERLGAPPRRVPLDAGDPTPALRGFAAEVARVGGRLTALLPEAEVWRGRVVASDRRAAAGRAATAALGVPREALTLIFGPTAADGLCAAAATQRATLAEARAFLSRGGLRPARITAAGAFSGFDRPPSFPRFALPGAPDAAGIRAAKAGCRLAATLALALWLAPWRVEPPAAPAPVAALAPAPIPPSKRAEAPKPARIALASPRPRARPADLPAPASGSVTRTAVRPDLVPVGLAARNAPPEIEPPVAPSPAPAAPAARSVATLAAPDLPKTRPVPIPTPAPQAVAAPAPTAAPEASTEPEAAPVSAARPANGTPGPRPRPSALGAAAPSPPPAAGRATTAEGGPRPRPVSPAILVASLGAMTVTDASTVPPARAAAHGPWPRPRGLRPPAADAPVVLAALSPEAAPASLADAVVAPVAAVPPPRARRIAPTAAPAPASVAVAAPAAPARAQPAPPPAEVRVARLQPPAQPVRKVAAPARTLAPAAQPVRVVRQTPLRVVRQAQPVRVQPVRAQPAPVRQARAPAPAQPARNQPGLRGESLALIGIFGAANGRHALVQTPSGDTERVRAGDQLQGVQVTAIAADAVHLRARGRDTVLRLPD